MIIRTSRQLKDKIANLSDGNSRRAQELIRNYMMERFLARLANSEYRDHFILKGGMLIASLVGMESRTTKDIDVSLTGYPLSIERMETLFRDVLCKTTDDGIQFHYVRCEQIMEQHEYPGVRIHLEASLDQLRQSISIDISTGDEITPGAVDYSYKMMFDEERILLRTYNFETLLAEKMETILSGDILNTRMRDFYDVYLLSNDYGHRLDRSVLKQALDNTTEARGTQRLLETTECSTILERIKNNVNMRNQWDNYVSRNPYVGNLNWADVVDSIDQIFQETLTVSFEEKLDGPTLSM